MKKLIVYVLMLLPTIVLAATTPTLRWYNVTSSQWSQATAAVNFSTLDAVCQYVYSQSSHSLKASVQLINNSSCRVLHQNGATISDSPIYTVYACPVGTTRADGGFGNATASTLCTLPACPTGQAWSTVTNSCSQDCSPFTGKLVSFAINGSSNGPDSGASVCMENSCLAKISGSEYACMQSTGKCFGSADGKYTGAVCNGSGTPLGSYVNPANTNPAPTNLPETDCVKSGKSFGTVNGATVCVNAGTAGAPPIKTNDTTTKDTTTTTSGGSATAGSTTTTEITQDGAEVTTKKTETDNNGNRTEEVKKESFDDFCQNNPTHKLCKISSDESKFTGGCTLGFECKGDAIQCAIATKQHQTYCENSQPNQFTELLDSEMTAANEAMANNNGSILPNTTINVPTTIQGQKLLTSNCIVDIVFSISGHSITLPLSKLCPALEFAGQMVLIISYLICGYILFGHKGAQ